MPSNDRPHTGPSPGERGDFLSEFGSEARGRGGAHHVSPASTPPSPGAGSGAPGHKAPIVLIKANPLFQFSREPEHESAEPDPQIEIDAPEPHDVRGTEHFAESALLKAKAELLSLQGLPANLKPAPPRHSVRVSRVLVGATAPVVVGGVLVALYSAGAGPFAKTAGITSLNDLQPSPLEIASTPAPLPERPQDQPAPPVAVPVPIAATLPSPEVPPSVAPRSASTPPAIKQPPSPVKPVAILPRDTKAQPQQPPAALPASTPASFRGSLSVRSSPEGAQVILNGAVVGVTPLVLQDITVGSRVVRVELEGHERWSSAVRIVANQTTTAVADLRPSPVK